MKLRFKNFSRYKLRLDYVWYCTIGKCKILYNDSIGLIFVKVIERFEVHGIIFETNVEEFLKDK